MVLPLCINSGGWTLIQPRYSSFVSLIIFLKFVESVGYDVEIKVEKRDPLLCSVLLVVVGQ